MRHRLFRFVRGVYHSAAGASGGRLSSFKNASICCGPVRAGGGSGFASVNASDSISGIHSARPSADTLRANTFHTRTGTAIGTAAYLSPEQVRGEQVTGAADVYALGLVLLEALTGTRAFPGSATEAALAACGRNCHRGCCG